MKNAEKQYLSKLGIGLTLEQRMGSGVDLNKMS
jgi:hypothetical protein